MASGSHSTFSIDSKSSILPWAVKKGHIKEYCLECPHCRLAQGPRSLEENMLHPLVSASALTGAVHLQRVTEGLEEQAADCVDVAALWPHTFLTSRLFPLGHCR